MSTVPAISLLELFKLFVFEDDEDDTDPSDKLSRIFTTLGRADEELFTNKQIDGFNKSSGCGCTLISGIAQEHFLTQQYLFP